MRWAPHVKACTPCQRAGPPLLSDPQAAIWEMEAREALDAPPTRLQGRRGCLATQGRIRCFSTPLPPCRSSRRHLEARMWDHPILTVNYKHGVSIALITDGDPWPGGQEKGQQQRSCTQHLPLNLPVARCRRPCLAIAQPG